MCDSHQWVVVNGSISTKAQQWAGISACDILITGNLATRAVFFRLEFVKIMQFIFHALTVRMLGCKVEGKPRLRNKYVKKRRVIEGKVDLKKLTKG